MKQAPTHGSDLMPPPTLGMILMSLAIGLPNMMRWLLQATFTFWSVRYAVRHAGKAGPGAGLLGGIHMLLIAMVIMMPGMTGAALLAILQHLTRTQHQARGEPDQGLRQVLFQ